MEKAAVHGAVSQDTNCPGIGIGEDRFGSVLVADFPKARSDGVEGFVPGNALERFVLPTLRERGLGDLGATAHGVEQAIGRINAVKIFGDFAAEKSAGDGVIGVALDSGSASCVVDRDQHSAGVRTIVGADGVDGAGGHALIVCPARGR